MQIHELTQPRVDEALGGMGSFLSGLTGGMSDKYMDKNPAVSKVQNTSEKWQDKYADLPKDPNVTSYVKTIVSGWADNAPKLVQPTQGLQSKATLQQVVPTLVTAAKKSNNQLTSAQIGQILAKSAPTIWKDTPDRPDPAKPDQVDKATAIKQLADELRKQGVTVDSPAPSPAPTYDPAKAAADKLAKDQADQSATIAALKARQLGQFAPAAAQTKAAPAAAQTKAAPAATTQTKTAPAATQTKAAPAATPKVRAKYPKAPTAGKVAEPPVFLGGKKLDPKKPGDAKTLAAIKAQGKLNEAATIGPAADQYKAAFVQWSDGQLSTRVRETGTTVTMDAVRTQFPDLKDKLLATLNQIIATQGTPQQAKAIEEYIKLSVAGVQAVAQMQKNKTSVTDRQQNKQFANTTDDVKQSLRQAGVDPNKLAQFGAQAEASGNPMTARRSDNPALNTLAKLAGFTLT
jgi:hypothetical protein